MGGSHQNKDEFDGVLSGTSPVTHDIAGIGSGQQTISVTGTAVALAGSTAARWVLVQAYENNADPIAVGDASVDESQVVGTGTGNILYPTKSISIPCDDLADIYINGTSGDGVRYTFYTS